MHLIGLEDDPWLTLDDAAGMGDSSEPFDIRPPVCRHFLASRRSSARNSSEFEDCTAVTVLLDGEEVQLQIEEHADINEDYSSIPAVDAVLVVFSTIDRITFQHAHEALCALRRDVKHDVIVLVANKIDLIRIRQVAEQEGKSAAATFDCKYFEVSALMSLRVDELLAGVVNQIRLRKLKRLGPCSPVTEGRKSPLRLINKILKRQAPVSKSCDNLQRRLGPQITHYQLSSNLGVDISEGCFIFDFASLPLEVAQSI
ncbi:hypothetical protein LSH36_595g03022 [Paralvinella palmiformis]|uniref:Uncharacterized protein n=1 Tax=Paralvinella palmiformis TaxID=53620 RepID=A0AAD9J557_9ANNE|nr:hypothetical protein LSH36_595g03022 [Paralvinella palmiformis]